MIASRATPKLKSILYLLQVFFFLHLSHLADAIVQNGWFAVSLEDCRIVQFSFNSVGGGKKTTASNNKTIKSTRVKDFGLEGHIGSSRGSNSWPSGSSLSGCFPLVGPNRRNSSDWHTSRFIGQGKVEASVSAEQPVMRLKMTHSQLWPESSEHESLRPPLIISGNGSFITGRSWISASMQSLCIYGKAELQHGGRSSCSANLLRGNNGSESVLIQPPQKNVGNVHLCKPRICFNWIFQHVTWSETVQITFIRADFLIRRRGLPCAKPLLETIRYT